MKQGSTSCRRNSARCASCFCIFRCVFDEKNEDVLPKRKDVQRGVPRIYSGLQGKEFTGRNHPPLSGIRQTDLQENSTQYADILFESADHAEVLHCFARWPKFEWSFHGDVCQRPENPDALFLKCRYVPVFSHLSIILIHIHGFLQKFPHFYNDRLRRQYLYPSAKRLNPRKEGWAALHGDSDNEMVGIAGNHHHVLAELVHHGGFLWLG